MSRLKNLKEVLVEKLEEWANDENTAEILVDTFLASMDAEERDSDEQLQVLDGAIVYFQNGGERKLYITKVLKYEALAIRVNEGY